MKAKKHTGQTSAIAQVGKNEKRCSHCKRIKNKASFNKDSSTPDGLSYQCRVCRLRTQKKSKAKYLRKVDALKAELSCAKCGDSRSYVLDFHHNDPKKKRMSISDMRDKQLPLDEIKKEIAKCTVLCASCHRELHYLKLTTEQYLKENK